MFRQATDAAANPRTVSRMITENIRKIRDLRIKKLTIIKTSAALFAGITFGICFAIYVSLVIAQHLNEIWLETGNPFEGQEFNIASILVPIPPEIFENNFILIFFVLMIHSFMLATTIRVLRGSHKLASLLYFVIFAWIVAGTAVTVNLVLSGSLTI